MLDVLSFIALLLVGAICLIGVGYVVLMTVESIVKFIDDLDKAIMKKLEDE